MLSRTLRKSPKTGTKISEIPLAGMTDCWRSRSVKEHFSADSVLTLARDRIDFGWRWPSLRLGRSACVFAISDFGICQTNPAMARRRWSGSLALALGLARASHFESEVDASRVRG